MLLSQQGKKYFYIFSVTLHTRAHIHTYILFLFICFINSRRAQFIHCSRPWLDTIQREETRECRPRPRNRSNRYRYITAGGGGFSSPSTFVREKGRKGERNRFFDRSITGFHPLPLPYPIEKRYVKREGKIQGKSRASDQRRLLLGFSLFTLLRHFIP